MWKFVVLDFPLVVESLVWKVGDGTKVILWENTFNPFLTNIWGQEWRLANYLGFRGEEAQV
jgi:hypothetical protein